MGCFDNLLSVRGLCEPQTPTSSIYMDDIGVTKNDIEAFMTDQYTDALDYFQKRNAFAVRELEGLIYGYFNGKYRATSIIEDHRLGIYDNAITPISLSGYGGIQIEFHPSDTYYKFELSEISLRVNTTATIPVVIYDLRQGLLLDTVNIDTTSGVISSKYINKILLSKKQPLNLFIGFDGNGIDAVTTPIKSGLCCGKVTCSNSCISSNGVTLSGGFFDSNTTTANHTSGLSVVYSISCDHLTWLCAYANSMALPLGYKLAEIMVSDALMNSGGERATNSHTVNIDDLERRYGLFQNKFRETFTYMLENMKLPCNRCFDCNSPTRTKIAVP